MDKINPAELDDRLSNGTAPYVLDIRPRKTYQRSHIDGSQNVPVYNDLRRGDDDELRQSLSQIPADETVVTVCKAGVVARKATTVLEEEGYEAATLAGGMRRWNGYQNGSLGYRLSSLVRRVLP
ncbi:rhodanese domain protein [Natrialba magadii ATCC 43099]|uniref:Rhodanese n=1 Tax=Natrialba magadii (strain ATCC 43099 / DSM 3394 / CCM 3739 / CIP 104546 / IAM 13178 / JCM 8861 / NBRC 102185 / NCIMB 2190 / MS3) TaxID=547559 RepID=D3SZ16_NATMM|nr:rhodanese-like domain-containing protein [Natrialba magadii]ADD06208.1 rhodanese domain protein [Natrialba magadii ATCC 43099]ELY31077.1 rhodanese [Natrialba magadii ATCC 43099]